MSDDLSAKIDEVCKPFLLSDEVLGDLSKIMLAEIQKGLNTETNPDSSIKCFPTYVRNLPTGKETGKYLGLDLGGTNFRVLVAELGQNRFRMKSQVFALPEAIMRGAGEKLFDHIALCLATFIKEQRIDPDISLPLGFTFSFPCRQEGLRRADLSSWTKGFSCSGVVGEDVGRLLQEAIERRGDIHITLAAVLNDTTGTLMSCAHHNPNCRIGLIVGTGTNACYVEKLSNIDTVDAEEKKVPGPDTMIINLEWGGFGSNGCIDFVMTEYDEEVDKNSINVGQQRFEKMFSGMYLGELARLILIKLTGDGVIFTTNANSQLLTEKAVLTTKHMSDIEEEKDGQTEKCAEILISLGVNDPSPADCVATKKVCKLVCNRAAKLTGMGIATILNKMGEKKVTVGVDGSLIKFHPHFQDVVVAQAKKMVPDDYAFDLAISEDGSGRGAALVAAVSCHMDR